MFRTNMTRAQYNTVYAMLILALSIAVMLGLFIFSNQIKSTAVKNIGDRILDDISDKVYASLLDMKVINDRTAVNNLTIIISVPKRVGEQNYIVRGEGGKFSIRTFGKRSLETETNTSGLWNVTLAGTAFSQSGKVQMDYMKTSNTVLFS